MTQLQRLNDLLEKAKASDPDWFEKHPNHLLIKAGNTLMVTCKECVPVEKAEFDIYSEIGSGAPMLNRRRGDG